MYKEDLVLNNRQRLICWKTNPNHHFFSLNYLYVVYNKIFWSEYVKIGWKSFFFLNRFSSGIFVSFRNFFLVGSKEMIKQIIIMNISFIITTNLVDRWYLSVLVCIRIFVDRQKQQQIKIRNDESINYSNLLMVGVGLERYLLPWNCKNFYSLYMVINGCLKSFLNISISFYCQKTLEITS